MWIAKELWDVYETVKHLDQYLKILNYLVHKSMDAVLGRAHEVHFPISDLQ
jgi:hypothetical protein